ncbi:MAG: hypothetical protein LBV04_00655 [Deferribacteraceae bacterium]|jgi:LPS-assembly protein|nr:hypothetical protein [Deferribacteraceae bacterium]
MKRLLYVMFAMLLCTSFAFAQGSDSYKLTADKIYGVEGSYYTAEGQVTVIFRNTQVTADTVTYFPAMGIIEAMGNVNVTDETQNLNADRVTYDMTTEMGVIDNVTGVLNGEYFVCAQSVQKLGKEYYVMEGAVITTCEGPLPDWSFSFQRVRGELDGYLVGDHTTMNIKDMPLMYVPKFIYPLKVTRQTGFLIPDMGYSTDLGYHINENFFWAIDYDKDATIGASYFSERGVQMLGEFRYTGSKDNRIYLSADTIYDSESVVDASNRWEYITKASLSLPLSIEFIADSYSVSDNLFMRDFGAFSLYDSNENLENTFHQYYNLGIRTQWADWSIYYRDSYKYKDTDTGYTRTSIVQEPSVQVQKYNLPLKFLTADYHIAYDHVYYEEEQTFFTAPSVINKGDYQRIHGEASLYKSINADILNITPSITAAYTRWQSFSDPIVVEEEHGYWGSDVSRSGDAYSRFIPTVGVQVDMNEIFRSYSLANHGIINTFSYAYTSMLEQEGLPDLLIDDIIETRHEIAWTMTNYVRGEKWGAEVSMKQGVDINLDDIFLPMELKGYLYMPYFRSTTEAKVSLSSSELKTRSNDSLILLSNSSILTLDDAYRFYFKYTYDNMILNNYNASIELGANFKLWSNLELQYANIWRAEHNSISLSGFSPTDVRAGFIWHDQCWSLGLAYTTEKYMTVRETNREYRRDHTIELIFSLKGLGGSSVDVYNDNVVS